VTDLVPIEDRTPEQKPVELLLTVDDVVYALAHIASLADDPEAMHGSEDALHRSVLQAVAAGHPQARELAAAALRTNDIDAPRWCA
jgi:hypothetical protein